MEHEQIRTLSSGSPTTELIKSIGKEKAFQLLAFITTFSRQFNIDPTVIYFFILLLALLATSIWIWVLSYFQSALFVGLFLCGAKIGLRALKIEVPALLNMGEGEVKKTVRGKKERIEGLEELKGKIKGLLEEGKGSER